MPHRGRAPRLAAVATGGRAKSRRHARAARRGAAAEPGADRAGARCAARSVAAAPRASPRAEDDPAQRRQDDQGARPRPRLPPRRPPGRPGRVAEVPLDRPPLLARRRRLPHGARARTRPTTPGAWSRSSSAEGVDVYVPVCSPASSRYDALAKAELSEHCEVLHLGADEIDLVDDKYEFALTAADLDLPVPRLPPRRLRRRGRRVRLRRRATAPTSSRASPTTRSAGST